MRNFKKFFKQISTIALGKNDIILVRFTDNDDDKTQELVEDIIKCFKGVGCENNILFIPKGLDIQKIKLEDIQKGKVE